MPEKVAITITRGSVSAETSAEFVTATNERRASVVLDDYPSKFVDPILLKHAGVLGPQHGDLVEVNGEVLRVCGARRDELGLHVELM
jgi:hypothetical protein